MMKRLTILIAAFAVVVSGIAHAQLTPEDEKKLKALLPLLESIEKVLRHGAIVPFKAGCPQGWDVYDETTGRFLVGWDDAGSDMELGVPDDSKAEHDHADSYTSEIYGFAHRKDDDSGDSHSSASNHQHYLHIAAVTTMPPYVPVAFCVYNP